MIGFIEWKWDELGLFHYIILGGGAVLLIALLMYFIPSSKRSQLQVPAIVAAVLASLAVGVAGGALGAAWFGEPSGKSKDADKPPEGGRSGPPGGGGFQPPPGFGPPGGGGGGGFGQQDKKRQLTSLVGKLDLLVEKPITLKLTDEQKKKLRAQLEGLETQEKLSDEDAEKRLEALEAILEEQKPILDMVRIAGEGGQGGGRPGGGRPGGGRPGSEQAPENPFGTERFGKVLPDLRVRLGGSEVKKPQKPEEKKEQSDNK
jgi:hypothetical protein